MSFRLASLFSVFLSMIVFLVACQKKREESFVQGQGKDLHEIAAYDGKVFDVETLHPIGGQAEKEVPKVSVAKSAKISNKGEIVNHTAVKVNTKAELLGDAPFIAVANNKNDYKIKYTVLEKYLVVSKVVKDKKFLHLAERPGAIVDAKDGTFSVPIVAYPIKGFFNVENQVSGDEKTNKLSEFGSSYKTGSKYFRFDRAGKILYELQKKQDLFKKDFFEGEWYFADTIIATNYKKTGDLGFSLNLMQYYQGLHLKTKIKFSLNGHEIRAHSVNVDKRINIKDEVNQDVLFRIPILWKEFRPKKTGDSFEIVEEDAQSSDWQHRDYLQVIFAGIKSENIFGQGEQVFLDMELDDNYFSFTIFHKSENVRIKYSFLKDKDREPYAPKLHLKDDAEKFGFFTAERAEFNNFEKYKKEDFERNTYITRFNTNTKDKKITFYFTEGSDDSLIPHAVKAGAEWTEAFRAAGVPVTVEVRTDKKVALGDLRYNAINLIRSANESNLFGFGPTISDPNTGEIISATTNMHITSIQGSLADHIRQYILWKSGRAAQASINIEPVSVSDDVKVENGKVVVSANTKRFMTKFPVRINGEVKMLDVVQEKKDEKLKKLREINRGREFNIGVTGKNLNEEIEEACPEINSIIDKIKTKTIQVGEENKFVINCSEKLVPSKMMGTLLHEMGHNFGLRHNFYASVDKNNFLPKEKTNTKTQVQSSSVMEYPSFGEDRLNKIGEYDIAAIRYGYADTVKTEDGQLVKLDTAKTIAQNLGEKNAHDYKFCTDEDVELNEDPMCARHDAGTNPHEIVKHIIAEYGASIAKYNYRYDRAWGIDPYRLTQYRVQRYWIDLKRYYDEWRFKLADQMGMGKEYLDNFNKVSYQKELDKLLEKDETLKSYKAAADEIFRFSMQIATLPPKYCIGERNGKLASVEFADIRKLIYYRNKVVPQSCTDKLVVEYVLAEKGFKPTHEAGYELEDVKFNMDPKAAKEPYDIIGLMPEKMIAVAVLNARVGLSFKYEEKRFNPNFMDEPDYREEVLQYLADRLAKGFDSRRLVKAKDNEQFFFEKFKYEKRYIESLVSTIMYDGLEVPDKSLATRSRKKPFLVKFTDKKDIVDRAFKKVLSPDGSTYYAVMTPEGTEALKLLEKLETLPARMEAAVPINDATFVGLSDLAKASLPQEGSVEPAKFGEFLHQILDDELSIESMLQAKYNRPKEQKDADKNRVHWKKIFPKEVFMMRKFLNETKEEQDATADNRVWSLFYEVTGKNIIEAMKKENPNYVINQNDLQKKISAYVTENTSKQRATNDDSFEYDELAAQYELILSMLRRMTEY